MLQYRRHQAQSLHFDALSARSPPYPVHEQKMLILDIPRPFDGSNIKVPLYHRGHLSLFTGATVWLCLLPGHRDQEVLPEIVVSPIAFDAWADLWRISMTMIERVGLVHDVFETLKEHKINVLVSESSSMDRQRYHSLEIIVDASRYSSPGSDGDTDARSSTLVESLPDLRRAIIANVFRDVAILPSNEARLKIRRVRSLFQAKRDFSRAESDYHRGLGFRPEVAQTKVEQVPGQGVALKLSGDLQRALTEALDFRHDTTDPGGGYYLPVSETADRFLRIYFIRNSRPIISLTTAHEERVGALATITEALHAANFDILTSLSRLYEYGARASFDLVLKPPRELGTDIERIRSVLEAALSTAELVNNYKIQVAYPRQPTTYSALDSKQLFVAPDAPLREPRVREPTGVLLQEHYQQYAELSRRPAPTKDEIQRFELARNLLAEHTVATAQETKRQLFISYSFSDTQRFDRVYGMATDLGFDVVTGRILGSGTSRDQIIRLMRTCTDFLGIWTEDGGIQMNSHWWPSPWLHWEFGAAQALGLRPHLLISTKIDPSSWQRIAAETVHTLFGTGDFEQKSSEALQRITGLAVTQ